MNIKLFFLTSIFIIAYPVVAQEYNWVELGDNGIDPFTPGCTYGTLDSACETNLKPTTGDSCVPHPDHSHILNENSAVKTDCQTPDDPNPLVVRIDCNQLCKSIPLLAFTGGECVELPEACGLGGSAKCNCNGGADWIQWLNSLNSNEIVNASPIPNPSQCSGGIC